MAIKLQETRQGAVTVLQPQGPLTSGDAEAFGRRVDELLTRSLGRLVMDLGGMPYVDSVGLELLMDAADKLAESGRTLKVCGLNETIREVFELTELTPSFDIYEDVSSAVRSFL